MHCRGQSLLHRAARGEWSMSDNSGKQAVKKEDYGQHQVERRPLLFPQCNGLEMKCQWGNLGNSR